MQCFITSIWNQFAGSITLRLENHQPSWFKKCRASGSSAKGLGEDMKSCLLVLIAVLSSHLALADGGASTGGGNGYGSTREQVIKAVEDAPFSLSSELTFSQLSGPGALLRADHVSNPDVKKVLATWEKDPELTTNELINNSSRILKEHGPCKSTTGSIDDHDASTGFQMKAPICFSVERLQRFPVWALRVELMALVAHELAHHFGFGEREAKAIQSYIFQMFPAIQIQIQILSMERAIDRYTSKFSLSGSGSTGSDEAKIEARSITDGIGSFMSVAGAYDLRLAEYSPVGQAILHTTGSSHGLEYTVDEMKKLKSQLAAYDALIVQDVSQQ
jgi:hypothetical protein